MAILSCHKAYIDVLLKEMEEDLKKETSFADADEINAETARLISWHLLIHKEHGSTIGEEEYDVLNRYATGQIQKIYAAWQIENNIY